MYVLRTIRKDQVVHTASRRAVVHIDSDSGNSAALHNARGTRKIAAQRNRPVLLRGRDALALGLRRLNGVFIIEHRHLEGILLRISPGIHPVHKARVVYQELSQGIADAKIRLARGITYGSHHAFLGILERVNGRPDAPGLSGIKHIVFTADDLQRGRAMGHNGIHRIIASALQNDLFHMLRVKSITGRVVTVFYHVHSRVAQVDDIGLCTGRILKTGSHLDP